MDTRQTKAGLFSYAFVLQTPLPLSEARFRLREYFLVESKAAGNAFWTTHIIASFKGNRFSGAFWRPWTGSAPSRVHGVLNSSSDATSELIATVVTPIELVLLVVLVLAAGVAAVLALPEARTVAGVALVAWVSYWLCAFIFVRPGVDGPEVRRRIEGALANPPN